MVTAWSLRLGGYLSRRVMGDHPVEDGRYQQLREEWSPSADRRFFWFFQLQGLLNVILSVPVLVACLKPTPRLHPLEGCSIAVRGESVADGQLDRFRRDPGNEGRACRAGLWRTSRHPNNFFEWLVWVAYFAFALASPGRPSTPGPSGGSPARRFKLRGATSLLL